MRAGKTRQKERGAARERLVEAAYNIISRNGKFTAREVKDLAECSLGALTTQFKTMDALRAEVAKGALGELIVAVREARGTGDPAADRLKDMARACVVWVVEHAALYRLLMADAYEGYEEIGRGREELFNLVGDQVVRVQASGHLPPGDPRGPAQLVIGVVWGMMQQALDRQHTVKRASDDVTAAIDGILEAGRP